MAIFFKAAEKSSSFKTIQYIWVSLRDTFVIQFREYNTNLELKRKHAQKNQQPSDTSLCSSNRY